MNTLPAFHDSSGCSFIIQFTDWSSIFTVVGLTYVWNLSIILCTSSFWLVDNDLFPYLGSSFSAMFESHTFGISVSNWKELGKKKTDLNYISKQLAFGEFLKEKGDWKRVQNLDQGCIDDDDNNNDNNKEEQYIAKFKNVQLYASYAVLFCINNWLICLAKICMYSTFKNHFIHIWKHSNFVTFYNIETSLVTLLMVSNIFFSTPILSNLQFAAKICSSSASPRSTVNYSRIIFVSVYLVYTEFVITFVLLCVQYPLLVSVMYIGACILLTCMIFGMAILCLLVVVVVAGFFIYWVVNVLTFFKLSQRKVKHITANLTWLVVIFFAWVAGICLAFLFTTDNFDSRMCFKFSSTLETAAASFILISIIFTLLSMVIIKYNFEYREKKASASASTPASESDLKKYQIVDHENENKNKSKNKNKSNPAAAATAAQNDTDDWQSDNIITN